MSENAQPTEGTAPENRHLPVPIDDFTDWIKSSAEMGESELPAVEAMTETLLQTLGGTGRAMGVHFIPEEVSPEVVNEVRSRKIIRALKSVRDDRQLTIAAVGERCGVDKSVISRFENDTTDPRLSTLLRYAAAVGVDLTVHINGKNVSDYIQPMYAPRKITADMIKGMPSNPFTLKSPRGDLDGQQSVETGE